MISLGSFDSLEIRHVHPSSSADVLEIDSDASGGSSTSLALESFGSEMGDYHSAPIIARLVGRSNSIG